MSEDGAMAAVVTSSSEEVTGVAAADSAASEVLAACAEALEGNVGNTMIGAGKEDVERVEGEEDGAVSETEVRVVISEDDVTGVARDVNVGRTTTTCDEVVSTVCDVSDGDAAGKETGSSEVEGEDADEATGFGADGRGMTEAGEVVI